MKYLLKIVFHVFIGALLYYVNVFPRIFFFTVLLYFFIDIKVVHKNEKSTAVLKACAYLVGAEVIFRMTGAGIFMSPQNTL